MKHQYQYLHGCVNEVYKDLPDTNLPPGWNIPVLTHNLLAYGRDGDPHNHCMLLVRCEDEVRLLFSDTARKHYARSTAYYTQKYLSQIGVEELKEDFTQVLRKAFYTEDNFDDAAAGLTVQPEYVWSGLPEPLKISRNVLRAVLYSIANKWRMGSAPVVIAVPADQNYEQYTFSAVQQIYACMPAAARLRAGFVTYAEPDRTIKDVALYFLPERLADSKALWLDGRGDIQAVLNNNLPPEIKGLLDRIVDMPDAQTRTQFLQRLTEDVEQQTPLDKLRWSTYTQYLERSSLLDGDPEKAEDFRKYVDFADDPADMSETLQARVREFVQQRITADHLDRHVLDQAGQAADIQAYCQKISQLASLCAISQPLFDHVQQKLWTFCCGLLEKETTLDGIERLSARIEAIRGTKDGGFFGTQTDAGFGEKFDQRRSALIGEAIGAWEKETLDKLEKTVCKGNLPSELHNAYQLVINKRNSDLYRIGDIRDATARNAAQKHIADWLQQKINAFCLSCAELRVDPQMLTKRQYEKEKTRLQDLQKDIRKLDMIDREAVLRKLQESQTLLHERFHRSTTFYDLVEDNLEKEKNYFAAMKALLSQKQKEQLPADKFDQMRSKLIARRPADFDAYCVQYRQAYGCALTMAALGRTETDPGAWIAEDLEYYRGIPLTIRINGLTLEELLTKVQKWRARCEILADRGESRICLSAGIATIKDQTFPADQLERLLQGLRGRGNAPETASQDTVSRLVELLRRCRLLREEQRAVLLCFLGRCENCRAMFDAEWRQYLQISADGITADQLCQEVKTRLRVGQSIERMRSRADAATVRLKYRDSYGLDTFWDFPLGRLCATLCGLLGEKTEEADLLLDARNQDKLLRILREKQMLHRIQALRIISQLLQQKSPEAAADMICYYFQGEKAPGLAERYWLYEVICGHKASGVLLDAAGRLGTRETVAAELEQFRAALNAKPVLPAAAGKSETGTQEKSQLPPEDRQAEGVSDETLQRSAETGADPLTPPAGPADQTDTASGESGTDPQQEEKNRDSLGERMRMLLLSRKPWQIIVLCILVATVVVVGLTAALSDRTEKPDPEKPGYESGFTEDATEGESEPETGEDPGEQETGEQDDQQETDEDPARNRTPKPVDRPGYFEMRM